MDISPHLRAVTAMQFRAPDANHHGDLAAWRELRANQPRKTQMNDTAEMHRDRAPRKGRHPLLPRLTPQAELALLCRTLHREGYADHIAGHISVSQGDGTMLVNPWELAWDEVTASDILRIDSDGRVIAGDWNVTPAIPLHLAIHARRNDVRVIIHNHSRFGTLWANARRIPPIHDQTGSYVDGPLMLVDEYEGSVDGEEAADSCAIALGNAKWALLANHGVLIVAGSVRQAHLRAVTLEWRARQAWQLAALGGGAAMPDEQANALGARVDSEGFPFLWEAMARREIRLDPAVLS
jgi:ribulose-5-phosphate 4-epimerase/fuculose-1-phosphate aldolase